MAYIAHPDMIAAMRRALIKQMKRCLYIPERIRLPQWADDYRKLSSKSSARPGDFFTERVEIARGPMMAVHEPGVETISLMVATQLLKTTLIENIVGYFSHIDPAPMLAVYPNEDAAEAFSKERIAPMIAVTPTLKERYASKRSRKSDNTIEVKHFPGGFIAMVSAGSPMNLAARPIRIVLEDEIDKYAPTKEGDPIALAEERTSTFPNRLHIRACSPTTEETSRIYHSWLMSDQRLPYVECPHCGHWQYLDFFRHVHWEKHGKHHMTDTAAVFCESCGTAWTEVQRLEALGPFRIRWQQTAKFVCCNEGQEPRQNRLWEWDEENQVGYALCRVCRRRAVSNSHAGFNASKLYSPFITMARLAAAWIDCKDDLEKRQTFENTQLARPYKISTSKELASKVLAARRENEDDHLHDRVCVITCGVDVQSGEAGSIGRLEAEVVGWDPLEESWSLDHRVFIGDPAKPDVWKELDDFLLKPWGRADGRKLRILGTCIDSGGHHTEEVYKFCLARAGRNVWATKGASDRGGQWSPVWPKIHQEKHRRRYHRNRPVIIGVNAAKEAIRQRLLIETPGPGYCHFPVGRPDGYFDQLVAERLVVERKQGVTIRKWTLLAHQANEALDMRVLAYSALQGLINDRGFSPQKVAAILARPIAQVDQPVHEGVDSGEDEAELVTPAPVTVPDPAFVVVPGQPNQQGGNAGRMALPAKKGMTTRSSYMSRRLY